MKNPKTAVEVKSFKDVQELADWAGIETDFDGLIESNSDYIWDAGSYAEKEAIEAEATEVEIEKARNNAERSVGDALYRAWKKSVEAGARYLLESRTIDLPLGLTEYNGAYSIDLRAGTSWAELVSKLVVIINGVGSFEFRSAKELADSGPYTMKQAAVSHLGWVKSWPNVYGGHSAQRIFEDHLDSALRNV